MCMCMLYVWICLVLLVCYRIEYSHKNLKSAVWSGTETLIVNLFAYVDSVG